MSFDEKYRASTSLILGLSLCLMVGILWHKYDQQLDASLRGKVADTNRLVKQQFQDVLYDNIRHLSNLKHRLEVTDGHYFQYWNQDAGRLVDQEPSFLFVEWIDTNMVITNVEPTNGNEKAVGLDISKLPYRKKDWLQARRDSTINITHWVLLVQDNHAILVDAPVYYHNKFQGTITAGMDFSNRFDDIMKGFDEYYLEIKDERGQLFYSFGRSDGSENFKSFTTVDSIRIADSNPTYWTIRMIPNEHFADHNSIFSDYFILGTGLIMSVLIAGLFFVMQKSSAAERSKGQVNQQLRALIESSPLGIYVIDRAGRITDFWNEAAEQMLGWNRQEIMGKVLPILNQREFDELIEIVKNDHQHEGIQNVELTRNRKDGSTGIFRLNIGSMTGREGHMLVLMEDITKEKQYEHQLEVSLEEKKVMVAEIHHRVKNNLAIIIGLIDLQKEEVHDQYTQHLLKETMNRIYSISGVHEMLYSTNNFHSVRFDEYVENLIQRVKKSYATDKQDIKIHCNINCSNLAMNQAIPLGLLLNELFVYTFKKLSYLEQNARIQLNILEWDNKLTIHYHVNDCQMDISEIQINKPLEFSLIEALLSQLSAEYEVRNEVGMAMDFQFAMEDAIDRVAAE